MSEMRLVVRDWEKDLWADRDGGFAIGVFAALSADPETIEELDAALERFNARKGCFFEGFSEGLDDQPGEQGLAVFDLAARLVVWNSPYDMPELDGTITYHNGKRETLMGVDYTLSDEWMLASTAAGWRELAEQRREARRLDPPLDARAVLYGEPLLRFIAEETFESFRTLPVPAEREGMDPAFDHEYDLIRDIHVRWMMTPRGDLRGRTPRELIQSGRSHVDADLETRRLQWARMRRCPPGLHPTATAYRLGGFGTHEIVVYYDMVRELLWQCRHHVADYLREHGERASRTGFVSREVELLEGVREVWLDSPHGGSPPSARSLILHERARLPEVSSEQDWTKDHNCPFCRAQREIAEPTFLHLDSSHLDDEFAFAFWHDSFEEWEAEKLAHEALGKRFQAVREARQRLGVEYPGGGWADPAVAWERSFRTARKPREVLLAIRLFAIGVWLGELFSDLVEPDSEESAAASEPQGGEQIALLIAAFRRLSGALNSGTGQDQDEPLASALVDLQKALETVAMERPRLAPRCADLGERVRRFLEPAKAVNGHQKKRPKSQLSL
jgi:hypothetical protein